MSDREPASAAFDAQPLRPRRRRVDPAILIAAVAVIGIGVAVLKPWGGEGTAAAPTGSAAAELGSADPTGTAAATDPPAARPVLPPSVLWRQVAPVLVPHATWGVRAVVRDPPPGSPGADEDGGFTPSDLTERWMPVEPTTEDARPVVLETPDQGVLALGITFPPDDLPLDMRVWLAVENGWAWAGTAPLDPAPGFGGYLMGPPTIRGLVYERWPAGRYRIDVLSGQGIRSLHVALPDRFEVVPGPDGPAAVPDATLVSPFAPRFPQRVEPGAFVVAGGRVVPVPAASASAPLDPATAWRDGTPSVHAPDATGLGVLLPFGAREGVATLHLVAPTEGPAPGRRAIGVRFDAERAPFVVFRAPRGAAWAPGTYRMDATWTDPGGVASAASYHVTLLPTPDTAPGLVLDAARGFREWAGRDGEVVGMPSIPGEDEQDLACLEGNEAVVTDVPTVVGLGHPPGEPPRSVLGQLQFDGGRLAEQPVLVATEALPGLTLVAPARTDSFVPGVYRLTLEGEDGPRSLLLCAGVIILE